MISASELAELRRAFEAARATNRELTVQRDTLQTQRDDALATARQLATTNTALATRLERAKTTIRKLKHALHGRRNEKLTAEELEQLGQVMFEFAGLEARGMHGQPLIPAPPAQDVAPDDDPRPEPKKRRVRRRSR